MEQKEIIKLYIPYFLVVIVSCETRFRTLQQTYFLEYGFGDATIPDVPAAFLPYQHKEPVAEKLPSNVPFNEAQYNNWNLDGLYANQYSANTERPDKYRDFQDNQEPDISPYTSNVTPSRQIKSTYPVRIYKKVNQDREPALYDKSFITNDVIDPKYRLYDEIKFSDQNKAYIYDESSPHQKFKKPNAKARENTPTRYGGIWDYYMKKIANKKPHRSGYPVVCSTRDLTGSGRGDLTNQDNLTQNDSNSYGNPYDYSLIDVKNRFMEDYHAFL